MNNNTDNYNNINYNINNNMNTENIIINVDTNTDRMTEINNNVNNNMNTDDIIINVGTETDLMTEINNNINNINNIMRQYPEYLERTRNIHYIDNNNNISYFRFYDSERNISEHIRHDILVNDPFNYTYDELNFIQQNTNDGRRHQLTRCLGCNCQCSEFVLGESNSNRICAICLESDNVCYGCQSCIDRNLPSCCLTCYTDMQMT
jgi:hypothetical protein